MLCIFTPLAGWSLQLPNKPVLSPPLELDEISFQLAIIRFDVGGEQCTNPPAPLDIRCAQSGYRADRKLRPGRKCRRPPQRRGRVPLPGYLLKDGARRVGRHKARPEPTALGGKHREVRSVGLRIAVNEIKYTVSTRVHSRGDTRPGNLCLGGIRHRKA